MDKRKKRDRPTFNVENLVARAKCRELNRSIAACASKKDLSGALEAFDAAKASGWSNGHTYSAMINTYIRCGCLKEAETIFAELRAHPKLNPDVITCTTMLKGYSAAGDIRKCLSLLEDMSTIKPRIKPNIRTVNTFLRCCLWTGATEEAETMLEKVKGMPNVEADTSTHEYMATLLCQGLHVDKVHPMLGRVALGTDVASFQSVAAMKLSLARALAVLGEWKICRKTITGARDALDKEESVEIGAMLSAEAIDGTTNLDEDSDEFDESDSDDSDAGHKRALKKTTGGKQGWKDTLDTSRAKSLELYRGHKRTEARRDLDTLESFVDAHAHTDHGRDRPAWVRSVLGMMRRVISSYDTPSSVSSGASIKAGSRRIATISSALLTARKRLGLETLLRRAFPSGQKKRVAKPGGMSSKWKNKSKKSKDKKRGGEEKEGEGGGGGGGGGSADSFVAELNEGGLKEWQQYKDAVSAQVDDDGALILPKVFGNELPCKLEVCSGTGEWVMEQARADAGRANWVAVEVRYDRVYQTLLRSLMANTTAKPPVKGIDTKADDAEAADDQGEKEPAMPVATPSVPTSSSRSLGLDNLLIMGGDAMQVIPRHLPPGSVSCVCVNYPEPPQQTGSFSLDFKSQGKHLLTDDFFEQAARVLVDGGYCTVVTDNKWYAQLLLRQLSKASNLVAGKSLVSIAVCDGAEVVERASGTVLFKGSPDAAHGYGAEASSYFDRLWKRNKQLDRFFIVLEKKEGTIAKRTTFDDSSDEEGE